ncbi:MAG TPA: FAD-dependent pyridine nucleotide-disulfide oxidoreductase [Sediminispirochaeta sp.]|nr:FAD-dependent pyridine nucleotide-disulfide oxidoreductase [Sediminispirochaeta sp.]
MKDYEVLVIGGGPAAMTLAKYIGREMKTALIRPEDHSMIYCAMPYAVEGLLDPTKTMKSDSIVTDSGAELIRDTVLAVDFEDQRASCISGKTYSWERLVIATGAEPILPPIPGSELEGVTAFKTEEDMQRIIDFVDSGIKDAVVVGAGAIGVELSQALAAKKVNTTLVDMAVTVLPNLLDSDMAAGLSEELRDQKVQLRLGSKISAVKGESRAEEVQLENGEVLPAQLVVFAVGTRAKTDIFADSGLEIANDGIVVDSTMRTNIDQVYAIGDCVSFHSGITGERSAGKLATNAIPMARVLADNLLGRRREYRGFFNGAATKIGNIFAGGTGLTEAEAGKRYDTISSSAEFSTAFPIMPNAKKVSLKLIFDRENGRLLGGQVRSGEPVTDKVDQITMAVQYGLSADDLLEFSYSSQPWQSFYPAHNLLVKAAEEAVRQLDPRRDTVLNRARQ